MWSQQVCRIFSIIVALLLGFNANATEEPYSNSIKGKLRKGDTLWVKDEKFRNQQYEWSRIQQQQVVNFVNLRFSNDSSKVPPSKFYAEVTLRVEYYTSPDQPQPLEKNNVKLKIEYNSEQVEKQKLLDFTRFEDAHWVKVYVEDIKSDIFSDTLQFVELETVVLVDRKYRAEESRKSAPAIRLTKISETGQDETMKGQQKTMRVAAGSIYLQNSYQLELSIPAEEVGEEFDIEWTPLERIPGNESFINQLLMNDPAALGMLESHFWNNASRQTLRSTRTTTITLAYREQYVCVRTRSVNYDADGIRIEGNWDYNFDAGVVVRYAVFELYDTDPTGSNSFQAKLNWQYTGTFADDGRKKEILGYYDGALRARQTLTQTREGDEATTVVTEPLLDPIGRPVANFLPVPIASDNMAFKKNTFGNDLKFDAMLHSTGKIKLPIFNPLTASSSNPASTYYSSQNNWITEGNNGFIPNANGFPFAVTGYTNDPEGRTRYQGGVGATFQPVASHSNNRTTRYYYAKPSQDELDRVFGNEIGYAEHYQKLATVDPNGQISLQYTNLAGKTVATALAGNTPANLMAIPHSNFTSNSKLLKADQFQYDRASRTITGSATHFATTSGPANFRIDFQRLLHSYTNGSLEVCNNCTYDVVVKIIDEYGEKVVATNETSDVLNFKLNDFNGDCTATGTSTENLSYNLPAIGEYTFMMEMRISGEVLDNRTNYYIAQRTNADDLHKQSHFLELAIAEMNLEDCYAECGTCIIELGEKTDFVSAMISAITFNYEDGALSSADMTNLNTLLGNKYDALYADCAAKQATCPSNSCSIYSSLMLKDVAPGGQYAMYNLETFSWLEPHLNVIALHFRTAFPILSPSHENYIATSVELPDGSVTSPHDANFTNQMLIEYWQEDWGYRFLPYHPEYCKLQFCENNAVFYAWDEILESQVTNLQLAALHDFTDNITFNNTAVNTLLAVDPFFQAGKPGAGKYSVMTGLLNNFSTQVLGLSNTPAKNINQYINFTLYCSTPGGTTSTGTTTWQTCDVVQECRVMNEEWRLFVSLYLEAKRIIYQQLQDEGVCAGACVVGSPTTIALGGCYTSNQFSISIAADNIGCTSGQKKVLLKLPSSSWGTTTIQLTYPVAFSSGLPASLTYTNGQVEKTLCVPVGLPIDAIVVGTINCVPPSIPSDYCPFGDGGSLNLPVSAVQQSPNHITVTNQSTGVRSNYYFISGDANNQPTTSNLCSGNIVGQPVFYSCYKVTRSSIQISYFTDVWVVVCEEDLCASAPQLNMELQLSTNVYSAGGYVYYVQPNGSSSPSANCTSPVTLYSGQCVKIKVGTGNPVTVTNATVKRCDACNVGAASIVVNVQTSSTPLTFSASNGTYYVFPNVSSTQSITPPACNGTLTNNWTNCLTVVSGSTSTTYNNARYYFCPASSCPYVTDFNVSYQVAPNIFHASEYWGGCSYVETQYTVYTGYSEHNMPPYTECPGFSVPDFGYYSCLQIYDNSTAQTYRYTNVWVKMCSQLVNNCWRSTMSDSADTQLRSGKESSSANVEIEKAFRAAAADTGKFRIVKNFYDGSVNLVRKASKSKTKQRRTDSIPGYSPFIYKSSLYIPRDSVGGEQFSDVEVATKIEYPEMQVQQSTSCGLYFSGGESWVEISPCGGDHHIGWSVTLDEPATQDINYTITVYYFRQNTSGLSVSLVGGTILQGSTQDSHLGCNGNLAPGAIAINDWCIDINVPGPQQPTCPPEFANKTSRFPDLVVSGSVNMESTIASKIEELASGIESSCEGGVEVLLSRLRPFLLTELNVTEQNLESNATYQRIKSRLIDVCKAGGDLNHPFGASTTRPGNSANGFTSFEAVLADEFALTMDYNPWLVGAPLPWGVTKQIVAPTVTRTNDVICAKLAVLQTEATAASLTLHQYLLATFGPATYALTESELEALQKGCSNCKYLLDEAITLPAFLDPSANGCIARAAFNDAITALNSSLTINTSHAEYATVYKNYLNSYFGMTLSFEKWEAFQLGSDNMLCNELFPDPIVGDPYACAKEQMNVAVVTAKRAYEDYIAAIRRTFQEEYVTVCMSTAGEVNLTTTENIYQYTLYYYDNAGNLLKTIAPKFVQILNLDGKQDPTDPSTYRERINLARTQLYPSDPVYNLHTTATEYSYNSLNQVRSQWSPDGGLSYFWYDTKGRLAASQNAEQLNPTTINGVTKAADRYSFTQYDALGRIIKVGELEGSSLHSTDNNSFVQTADLASFLGAGTPKQITSTFYDTEEHGWSDTRYTAIKTSLHNLRKRVVATTYQETASGGIEQGTYYSYDLMGNVKSLWQQVSGLPDWKRIQYQYELSSGKTTGVLYQDGQPDAFYHQYEYDAENRLKSVYTNTQKVLSAGLLSIAQLPGTAQDANYQYYLHGPLSRTTLGTNLQGIDYAYTLQGWLKSINGQDLNPANDMGGDGHAAHPLHGNVSRDAISVTLGYHQGDYAPINGSGFIRPFSENTGFSRGASLYNGNISHMTTGNRGFVNDFDFSAKAYNYDQLNRITNSYFKDIESTAVNWAMSATGSRYAETFAYDANGNILGVNRKGETGSTIDALNYGYGTASNRLNTVQETLPHTPSVDRWDINSTNASTPNLYTYDNIGNLTTDVYEGLLGVQWNVYGKIQSIAKSNNGSISYTYDAAGNRVTKQSNTNGSTVKTWYIRDAQGNTMATYETETDPTLPPRLMESHLYGASRLGVYYWNKPERLTPERNYELTNHLGNVLATISDKRIEHKTGETIEYYDADVLTAMDYYAFGMIMPEKRHTKEDDEPFYRMGFNGKENDDEVKGTGSQQDYGFRIYDPRLGRFLSVDPLTKDYPELTPYQFASNNPVAGVDLEGLEFYYAADGRFLGNGSQGGNQLRIATEYSTYKIIDDINKITKTGYKFTKWKEYKTNSDLTRLGRNEGGRFTGITSLSSNDVARLLAYGSIVIQNKYKGNAFQAALYESGGKYGLLDYKLVAYDLLNINRGNLLEIDGIVYNPNEAGNYLWGMLLSMYEYSIDPSRAAQLKTLYSDFRWDEDHDQKAILSGEKIGNELKKERRVDIQGDHCSECPRGEEKARSIFQKIKYFIINGTALDDFDKVKDK